MATVEDDVVVLVSLAIIPNKNNKKKTREKWAKGHNCAQAKSIGFRFISRIIPEVCMAQIEVLKTYVKL